MRAAMQLARAARAGSRSSMYQTHLPPVDLRAVCLVRAIARGLRGGPDSCERDAGSQLFHERETVILHSTLNWRTQEKVPEPVPRPIA